MKELLIALSFLSVFFQTGCGLLGHSKEFLSPTILRVVPNRGPVEGGTLIDILGENFGNGIEVRIGTRYCQNITLISSEQLRCVTPPGLFDTTVEVTVMDRINGMDSMPSAFTYIFSPPAAFPIPLIFPMPDFLPARGPNLENETLEPEDFNYFLQIDFEEQIARRKDAALRSLDGFPFWVSEDLNLLQSEVLQRITVRNERVQNIQDGFPWGARESIMQNGITRLFLDSINKLERRYPTAVAHAKNSLFFVYSEISGLDVSRRGPNAENKKGAALRFLDRVATDFGDDQNFAYPYPFPSTDPNGSLLSVAELISLAWSAVEDRTVFTSELDEEDRHWSFLESLATIQRAHNDNRLGGSIEFSLLAEQDKPSCSAGTFKRLLEHLDGLHPDVRLNPVSPDGAGAERITNEMVVREVMNQHRAFWSSLDSESRARIREGLEVNSLDYTNYVETLRAAVRQAAPRISASQLEENTNSLMMEALFDLE